MIFDLICNSKMRVTGQTPKPDNDMLFLVQSGIDIENTYTFFKEDNGIGLGGDWN